MKNSYRLIPLGSKFGSLSSAVLGIVAAICMGYYCTAKAITPDLAINQRLQLIEVSRETKSTHKLSSVRTLFFPDRKDEAKDTVNKLVAEDYEGIRKNFNETMKASLSAEKMKEVWKSMIEHLGEYKSQGQPNSKTDQNWEIVVIRCEMQRGQVDIEVDFDPSGKIGGLWVRPVS